MKKSKLFKKILFILIVFIIIFISLFGCGLFIFFINENISFFIDLDNLFEIDVYGELDF